MKLPSPFIKGSEDINAIIETPKGSRNKYAYDEETDTFKLKRPLPAGSVFPFDFGFIPSSIAEDGDPLDVLVLTDAPTFTGCIVECQVLGIIKVEQEEHGKKVRNDRVIAVHKNTRLYSSVNTIDELPKGLVEEITHFFASYNALSKRPFVPIGNEGPEMAIKLIRDFIQKPS